MFSGDCLRHGPEPNFFLVLLVPSPEPLLVKECECVGGCYPLGKHNWLVHEKSEQWEAAILQAISGLTQQELCTICTGCMDRARGKSMVGRKRRKMERSRDRENQGLGANILTNITSFLK